MQHLLLSSINSTSFNASPVIGSVPFSAINFSIKRLSKICFETGDSTACSGTSPLTKKTINKILQCSVFKFKNLCDMKGCSRTDSELK